MLKPKNPSRSQSTELSPVAGVRTGLSVADLKQSFLDNLLCGLGRVPMAATRNDAYTALALPNDLPGCLRSANTAAIRLSPAVLLQAGRSSKRSSNCICPRLRCNSRQ